MDDNELYSRIDEEDEMTDDEKREAYYAEIEERDQLEEWENGIGQAPQNIQHPDVVYGQPKTQVDRVGLAESPGYQYLTGR